MARIVKEEDYAVRRNEILDSAQRLVYSKGYEQMTIQDILNDLHISKGAFYHYFESKSAVLEAFVERLMDQIEPGLALIVQDPELTALQKLHRYYDSGARWKAANKAFVLQLMRVWYSDENAIVRQKMFAASVKRITPMLTAIIHQGIHEGVFTTAYPDYVSQVNINLLQGVGDTFADMLLSTEPDQNALERCIAQLEAYDDALERVLGAPKDSINLIDPGLIREWFAHSEVIA